ncbi:TetR/AcrR family transcriptional regulator [Shewanella youngdeokensis]|uniref:TetR/AcrR family transcriptional regulator n=1 Tax=Shewanella youngdeokensis TaxID=2999068 RepID=A0ABZ0K0U0_9GAMM|nr:TetR/AcrR family transcriptional regulator [Shewanella sp. DAU334]
MNNYLRNPPRVITDILKVASEVIKEQGICSIKMAVIAARAECSKKTLYNHFKCKEDIVVALFIMHFNDMADKINDIINSDTLSNQEKIIYSMSYDPVKCLAANQNDLCINFLGVNPHIYEQASPEFIGNLTIIFMEVKEQTEKLWQHVITEGEVLSSKEEVLKCIVSLNQVERGAVAMGQNKFVRQFGHDFDFRPTFDLLCNLLYSLEWKHKCPSLSYDNMLKTISPVVSKKTKLDLRHYALKMESLKESIDL